MEYEVVKGRIWQELLSKRWMHVCSGESGGFEGDWQMEPGSGRTSLYVKF